MARSNSSTFVGDKSKNRAARIDKGKWKRYECLIHDLYKKTTLEEVMRIMESEHNFKAR